MQETPALPRRSDGGKVFTSHKALPRPPAQHLRGVGSSVPVCHMHKLGTGQVPWAESHGPRSL